MSQADGDSRMPDPHVWVFHGEKASFASGVFRSVERAETWISKYGLSGVLTAYPVDEGAFD